MRNTAPITLQGAKRDLERILMRLLNDRTIRVIYVKEEGGDRRGGDLHE